MTSFIAAGGSGRSTSFIPAVPAAWSVTTIAFMELSPRSFGGNVAIFSAVSCLFGGNVAASEYPLDISCSGAIGMLLGPGVGQFMPERSGDPSRLGHQHHADWDGVGSPDARCRLRWGPHSTKARVI